MKKLLAFLLLLTTTLTMSATDIKAEADSAYSKEDYQKAITLYNEILKQGESPVIYYNLGGAYYKVGDLPHSILNYERAKLLSPGDDDIKYNLEFVRSKTSDKIVPISEMFFVGWVRNFIHAMSSDSWCWLGIISFIIMMAGVMVFLMSKKVSVRKTSFFSAMFFLLLTIFSNIFAYQLKNELENRTGAIVMSNSVPIKSTPSPTGTELYIIHCGTRVDILDDSINDWYEVQLADGKTGWIRKNTIERI